MKSNFCHYPGAMSRAVQSSVSFITIACCIAFSLCLLAGSSLRAEGTNIAPALESYLDLALKNNPGMRIGPVQLEAAELQLDSLPVWYLPDVYAEAGYGGAANSSESRVGPLARLVADWSLWDGGRRQSRESLIRLNQKRAEVQSVLARLDQAKSLGLLYLRICRLSSTLEIKQNVLREYGTLEALLGPRLRIGTASYSDLVNVRIRRADLRSEIQDIVAAIQSLKEQMRLQAGLEKDAQLPPAVPLGFSGPVTGADAHFASVENHPLFAGYRIALKYFEEKEELAWKEIYGMDLSLRLYGGYGPDVDAIRPERAEAGAQIRFRVPIFGSGDRESAYESRKKSIEADRLRWKQALLDLRSEIQQKSSDMDRHKSRIRSLEQLSTQARKALNIAYGDFRNGQKSPADMISSIETYGDLQMRKTERYFEWQLLLLECHLLDTYSSDLMDEKPESDENPAEEEEQPTEE